VFHEKEGRRHVQCVWSRIEVEKMKAINLPHFKLKLWDVSDEQIKRIEETGLVKKRLTLYSPYNGIVSMKMVNEGMHIKPGMPLMEISDISKVWVYADLYEYELPWVKLGQQASVQLPYAGSKLLLAKVSYIYPYVEAKTRTVKARLVFDNPGFDLRPDMYVTVRLEAESVVNALVIPVEAVLHSGEKKTVFVALEGGKFEPREVETGLQDGDGQLQILTGLKEGENVVISAQFMLDSESKLREAIQKMLDKRKQEAGDDESAQGEDSSSADSLFDDEPKESLEKLFD
ncbi:MAG: efflux RND transporter periplasmic adaptor subunit, partial [Geopsychrobacter sp.]|nr:efflux RND transporter periplasmic adaptor subunit [Geopsychrobacter sp.]